MTRHEVLSSVGKTVHSLIASLTPDPHTSCFKAFEQLGHLVRTSKAVTALEEPSYFTTGIQEIINMLDAHRTGFARTAEQENGAVAKSSKQLSVSAFVTHANQIVTKALQDVQENRLGVALASLHSLFSDITKAESFEDVSTGTIAVTNDPMRVIETEAAGSMTAAQTVSTSNAVSNPGDVSAAAPSGAPNPATGAVTALPVATSVGESNYVAKAAEDTEIAKSLSGMAATIEKASLSHRAQETGWVRDLNSAEFLGGSRRSSVDFEAGLLTRG